MTPFSKSIFTLLIILAGISTAFPQNQIDVKRIEVDQFPYITPNVTYLQNKEKLSIDSVLKQEVNNEFQPLLTKNELANSKRGELVDLGFSKNYYWFKFKIQNSDTEKKDLSLVIVNPFIREMELFMIDNKGVRSLGKSGSSVPFARRPGASNLFCYPIAIEPKSDATFYLFMDNKGQVGLFSMLLYSAGIFNHKQGQLYFSLGFLAGIILLTVIINLVLFIFKRDKLHLFYSLYALSAILVIMVYGNLDAQFLFPNQRWWSQISRVTSSSISLFLLFIVTRIFLRQQPANSKYYHVGTVMMALYLAIPIINIITTFYSSSVVIKASVWRGTILVIMAAFPIVILACIEKVRQGFKPAFFYLVAISAPMLGGVVMAFYLSGLNPMNLHPNLFLFSMLNPLDIGLGFEAVIICVGILYRYNLDKKEKDKLSFDLEKEKTKLAEQVLFTQEDERKRIAEDLHDELGGNLAAIKMSLLSLTIDVEKKKPLMQLIDSASTSARNISHNLMPPEFKDTELHVLLKQHYQRLNNKDVITFFFYCSGIVYPFNVHKKLMLYRVILEVTNNIIKHSNCSEATVQLIYYENYLQVMAEDNGIGFSKGSNEGIGLKNIHSRIGYLKGTIAIDSSLKGTTITIYIPYQA